MAATLDHQPTPAYPTAVRSAGMKLDTPGFHHTKTASASVDIMSPVNQNGCFEFDRIIKAGTVVKRTRKTKSWKPIYAVLRPNCLSIYKDKDETKLRHQINLSEITAVARQRDSKKKMEHVFGIFSPARNYHLGAMTDKDAQEWVDLIRTEARIGAEEAEMSVMGPTAGRPKFAGFGRAATRDNIVSSSSEAEPRPSSSITPEQMHSARRPSQALNYSGGERGSISDFDFSDSNFQASVNSLPRASHQKGNLSQQSNIGSTPGDERVVYHGWLYVLKSKGGVRQWKKIWVVLRPKCLAFYKTNDEYSATHIIPFTSIIDAVDIDPVSRSKQYCMQVICEEKNFKFCASDENSLAEWLGAFKSLLVKKKEAQSKRTQQPATNAVIVHPLQKALLPSPMSAQQPLAMK
ncbi:ph domain-containing protein [Pyrenophora tritici-repentis]|uniref:PH domain containing protein n=2 Tax=Pyrenophora tritici-repentis TaxID=45151 RepID=A0A922NA92_9PLEO|nr:PH domain containing protein [Pyrenophora tritici-repentis]KAI1666759.1 ph domain-containing protein [Pyrenophora tritici-repentis]KAI1682592.1 ph domain-containing protein [Pyrenophora tritici-repentis]